MAEAFFRVVTTRGRALLHLMRLLFLALVDLEGSDLLLDDSVVGIVIARPWCAIPIFWKLSVLDRVFGTITTKERMGFVEAGAWNFQA